MLCYIHLKCKQAYFNLVILAEMCRIRSYKEIQTVQMNIYKIIMIFCFQMKKSNLLLCIRMMMTMMFRNSNNQGQANNHLKMPKLLFLVTRIRISTSVLIKAIHINLKALIALSMK